MSEVKLSRRIWDMHFSVCVCVCMHVEVVL